VKSVKGGKEVTEKETDSVRSGVTIPYSPEFADLESNAPLLEKLRALTGGETFADNGAALMEAARSGEVYRRTGLPPSRNLQPIWYWLLLVAGILMFFDVGVRRVAIDPREVATAAQRTWERLRGRAAAATEPVEFLERLKSRKAQVVEAIDRTKGTRRFEGSEAPAAAAPLGAQEEVLTAPEAPRAAPPPGLEPKLEKEAADYTSRLLKAKKRVWEERDKEQPGP
jgi:hypothetical protein